MLLVNIHIKRTRQEDDIRSIFKYGPKIITITCFFKDVFSFLIKMHSVFDGVLGI